MTSDRWGRAALERRDLLRMIRSPQGTRPDWVVILLPTALSIKIFGSSTSETAQFATIAAFGILNGLLWAVALLRPTATRFELRGGPFIALCVASGIAITRPSGIQNLLVFLLVVTLALRLAHTVDGRTIVSSLVDGLGLYSLANVVLYAAGFRSPSEGRRLNLDAGGLDRIIFPLSHSINLPPVLAASYVAAIYFLIREQGPLRRVFRILCLISAIAVLVASGSRVPEFIALALPILAISFPSANRWLGALFAVFASVSAFVLPAMLSMMKSVLGPLMSMISNRQDSYSSIAALNGRDYIWRQSIGYWQENVNDFKSILLGYGVNGHYKSGASRMYYDIFAETGRFDAVKVTAMHNSFLEQLFDGGLLGWTALVLALVWTSLRLSGRISGWGPYGLAASLTLSALLLCSTTEVLFAPNANLITFWVLVILVAAACQGEVKDLVGARRGSVSNARTVSAGELGQSGAT